MQSTVVLKLVSNTLKVDVNDSNVWKSKGELLKFAVVYILPYEDS